MRTITEAFCTLSSSGCSMHLHIEFGHSKRKMPRRSRFAAMWLLDVDTAFWERYIYAGRSGTFESTLYALSLDPIQCLKDPHYRIRPQSDTDTNCCTDQSALNGETYVSVQVDRCAMNLPRTPRSGKPQGVGFDNENWANCGGIYEEWGISLCYISFVVHLLSPQSRH